MKRNASLLVILSILVTTAFARNPATWSGAYGRYGTTSWAINNQRVASRSVHARHQIQLILQADGLKLVHSRKAN